MRKRRLGSSDLEVTEIALGSWLTYSGGVEREHTEACTRAAFDAGINFFDTANVYGNGASETAWGEILSDYPRSDYVLATKVYFPTDGGSGLSAEQIHKQIDGSLQRLQTDHVDLYQIHGVDPLTPIDETVWALDDAVRAGKVRYVGVSNHAAWQIMKALGVSERRGFARFESVQAYYSVAGRDLEREVVPLVQDQQLGVLVWSPLAGGLLSGKFSADGGPDGSRRAQFDFPPVDRARAWPIVDAMREIAAAHDTTVARVALAWVLGQPWVTSVIIGARTDAQLQDNLAADALVLGPDERARLDALSALPPEYPGWMIERQAASRRA